MQAIAAKELEILSERLSEIVKVKFSKEATNLVAAKAKSQDKGARGIRYVIQSEIENTLIQHISSKTPDDVIDIDAKEEEIIFNSQK